MQNDAAADDATKDTDATEDAGAAEDADADATEV